MTVLRKASFDWSVIDHVPTASEVLEVIASGEDPILTPPAANCEAPGMAGVRGCGLAIAERIIAMCTLRASATHVEADLAGCVLLRFDHLSPAVWIAIHHEIGRR